MTRSAEARRQPLLLWPLLIGSVPFFASCAFTVFAVRNVQTANDDLAGLGVLIGIALAVLGLFIIVFNVLATRSRPNPAFIGGLGSVGSSVLLINIVQQSDVGWAVIATFIWAIANAGAVLYAQGGGPIRPHQQ